MGMVIYIFELSIKNIKLTGARKKKATENSTVRVA
jgi:hypothetical protein